MPNLSANLLNLDRKMVRLIKPIFTGHCWLNRNMCIIGLIENATYRFCQEEEMLLGGPKLTKLSTNRSGKTYDK